MAVSPENTITLMISHAEDEVRDSVIKNDSITEADIGLLDVLIEIRMLRHVTPEDNRG